jgi:cation:H+ antiporter
MIWFFILIFAICCVLLYFSGEWVVGGLMRMARFLGWREFVVAFFVMAFAASLPNLFIGITSALKGTPQLSFGDVAGNNIIALTLAVALAVLFAKGKAIPAESRMVQATSIFTIAAALLPLFLIFDAELSRIDGLLLIAFFVFYLYWLFSKKERFTKVYDAHKMPFTPHLLVSLKGAGFIKELKNFFKDTGKLILGIILLVISAQGIVASAQFFALTFKVPIILIGLLITGFGSALPEIYFAVVSAKRDETWMILGNLMGAVIVPATLVLGIVSLISPIEILDFSPLIIARIFLIISALFFFFFVRSDRQITKREALFLVLIYIVFVLFTLFWRG